MPILRNEHGANAFYVEDYEQLDVANFLRTHANYFNNLNGHYPEYDYYGRIPPQQVVKDLRLINRHCNGWLKELANPNQREELLLMALSETRNQLKALAKYQTTALIGSRLAEYQKKATVLFGKKAYHLLQEYYEFKDENFIEFEVSGLMIRVDAFGYYHTLTRHFSSLTREHLADKDFHIDNLCHRYMPDNIESILREYDKKENQHLFDNNHLMFSIGGKPYSLWFKRMARPKKGGGETEYYRFQTFYPVSDPEELKKFNSIKRLDFPPFKTAFNTRAES